MLYGRCRRKILHGCQTSLKSWLTFCSLLLLCSHSAPGKRADILRPCYFSPSTNPLLLCVYLWQSKARILLFPLSSLWRLKVLGNNLDSSFEETSQLKIITKQNFPQKLWIHDHTEKNMGWKFLKWKILCSYQQGWILKEKLEGEYHSSFTIV